MVFSRQPNLSSGATSKRFKRRGVAKRYLGSGDPAQKGALVATKANYLQCIQPGWSEPCLLQVQDCFVVWGDFALKQNQHGFHPGGSREPSITHGWLIHRSHGCIFRKANDSCDTHITPPSFVEKKKRNSGQTPIVCKKNPHLLGSQTHGITWVIHSGNKLVNTNIHSGNQTWQWEIPYK